MKPENGISVASGEMRISLLALGAITLMLMWLAVQALVATKRIGHLIDLSLASMAGLDTQLFQAIADTLNVETRRSTTAGLVALIAIPLLLGFWMMAKRTVNRWQFTINSSHELAIHQSAEMARIKQLLEARESIPTEDLERSRQQTLRYQAQTQQQSSEKALYADVLQLKTEQLRESEERFRGAFESAAVGIAIVAPDGRWLEINQAFCEIVGYSESELLATNYQSITHPDDHAADVEIVRRILAGEWRYYQWEKRYLHKSGRVVQIHLSVSLVRDARLGPLYFVAMIQDITARKEAEFERDRFFSHSLTPMCVYGYDGYFREFNPPLRRHLATRAKSCSRFRFSILCILTIVIGQQTKLGGSSPGPLAASSKSADAVTMVLINGFRGTPFPARNDRHSTRLGGM